MSRLHFFTAMVLALLILTDSARAQSDSWRNLAEVKPEAMVVIYLKNGGRMKQRLMRYDQDRIVTDVGEVARRDIAAISLSRPERLWDGTLRGGAIGVGVMIPAASNGNAAGIAGAELIAFLAGAGLGALFDAGLAKPDMPIFANTGNRAPALRKWTLRVPHQGLAGWLRHRQAHIMLKDGTYVHGTVVNGTETGLELEVRESSRQILGANTRVDTSEIATVIFQQKLGGSTAAAATGGAIAGFWTGLGLSVASDPNSGGPLAAAAAGGALAGSLLSGFGIDRMNHREITLVVE